MNQYVGPLLLAAAISVFTVGLFWLWHLYSVRAGYKAMSAFRELVVTLGDTLEDLQQRHMLLPHRAEEFPEPMVGETRAAYEELAARLADHKQQWLRLREAADQARELLKAETLFGSRRAREARRILGAADPSAALAATARDCTAPLERLERARQLAGGELQAFQQEDLQFAPQLGALQAAGLAREPHQAERGAAAALVEQARPLLPADPLATLRLLGEARAKIAAARRRATTILGQAAAGQALAQKIAEVEQAATEHRRQGLWLREEGANPDPTLAEARQHHAALREALNQADATAAAGRLARADALAEQARQGMERHLEARARCETEIPRQRTAALRLAEALDAARGHAAELARDFAPDSWLGVADNTQRVPPVLTAAQQQLEQAARHAAADAQQFLQAAEVLDQVARQHQHANAELTAVGKRRQELVELRGACQTQIDQLRGQADRVQHLLVSSQADRAAANERFRSARFALDRLIEDSRLPRPDWTRLTDRAREIQGDLERAEQMADEDRQLQQQAAAEIAETETVLRAARAFREHGFTPDLSAAEAQLAQARGGLAAQTYEEAIRLANAAEQLARAAHQESLARAQRRQQELEAQMRTAQAAQLTGADPPAVA